jgi:hypothetical protein
MGAPALSLPPPVLRLVVDAAVLSLLPGLTFLALFTLIRALLLLLASVVPHSTSGAGHIM